MLRSAVHPAVNKNFFSREEGGEKKRSLKKKTRPVRSRAERFNLGLGNEQGTIQSVLVVRREKKGGRGKHRGG